MNNLAFASAWTERDFKVLILTTDTMPSMDESISNILDDYENDKNGRGKIFTRKEINFLRTVKSNDNK